MPAKYHHEFRDPVHGFIRVSTDERGVVDSRPVQRLRHIHQLATSFLVYPGATHKRFEHSLGVMELAGRVFDVITEEENIHAVIREQVPEIADRTKRDYWRTVVRMAALCHDIGHLPFSHAAEHDLLPDGWDHERLSAALIESAEMEEIWRSMTPPIRANDVRKIAVGRRSWGRRGSRNGKRFSRRSSRAIHSALTAWTISCGTPSTLVSPTVGSIARASSIRSEFCHARMTRAGGLRPCWDLSRAACIPLRDCCSPGSSCSPRSTSITSAESTTSISWTSSGSIWRTVDSRPRLKTTSNRPTLTFSLRCGGQHLIPPRPGMILPGGSFNAITSSGSGRGIQLMSD